MTTVFHLQETLHVLQQVEAAIAAVVLQGDLAVGALQHVGAKLPGGATTKLPLGLQVAKGGERGRLR